MPRSTSDGGGSGTLLRSVLGKAPFQSVSNGEEESTKPKSPAVGKEYRNRASKIFSHARSSSAILQAEVKNPSFRSRRQKSLSHLERLNPVSSSRSTTSPTHSFHSDYSAESPLSIQRTPDEFQGRIIHHGEAHISQIGWRKRSEYLVLTERYLLRFKSIKKAADKFPGLFPTGSLLHKTSTSHSSSSLSAISSSEGTGSNVDSFSDLSSLKLAIPLRHIIAVQLLQQTRTRATLEVVSYTPTSSHVSSVGFHVERPNGRPHWLETLGAIGRESQQDDNQPIPISHWDLIRGVIGTECEQELDHARLAYPVLRRSNNVGGSAHIMPDDFARDSQVLHYLVIGKHKLFIVPLSVSMKYGQKSPSFDGKAGSYGIVCLSKVIVSERDDSFELVFRNPQQPALTFELASLHSRSIGQELFSRLENLIPNWDLKSYVFVIPGIPEGRLRSTESINYARRDTFSKVLRAYCAAWGLSTNGIFYTVCTDGNDVPSFQLLPKQQKSRDYSALEILAVLRALRHNDYFVSISFAQISFDQLATAYDHFGCEHICLLPKLEQTISMDQDVMRNASILFQEFSALILTGQKLRRLDLTGCIRRRPNPDVEDTADDRGCGIIEPLYHLCINQNTNIDWIILNDIHLSPADIEYVIGMLSNRDCHLRAIELSGCNLNMWSLRLLLSMFPTQRHTLEAINISNNPGRLSPEVSFDLELANCESLRTVDVSRMTRTPERVSLIPYEVITAWRLEELNLNHTSLNEDTVDTLVSYLNVSTSRPLQALCLKGCGLDGDGIAKLLCATSRIKDSGQSHPSLHLDLTSNNIESFEEIATILRGQHGPSSLTWRLLDFQNAKQFKRFIQALQKNKGVRNLDLSQLFLDFHLEDDIVEALAQLFSENNTLQELNLSANNSRLDNCQLGPSMHKALLGLAHNKALKILKFEDQAIGTEGATALAEVLKSNTVLRELHCENNNINLVGFTLLVDAMQVNHTVTFLSSMERDKSHHVYSIESSIIKAARPKESVEFLDVNITPDEKRNLPEDVANAIEEVGVAVDEHWSFQRRRLEQFLQRNRQLATGETTPFTFDDGDCATVGAEDDRVNRGDGVPSLEVALSEYGLGG